MASYQKEVYNEENKQNFKEDYLLEWGQFQVTQTEQFQTLRKLFLNTPDHIDNYSLIANIIFTFREYSMVVKCLGYEPRQDWNINNIVERILD